MVAGGIKCIRGKNGQEKENNCKRKTEDENGKGNILKMVTDRFGWRQSPLFYICSYLRLEHWWRNRFRRIHKVIRRPQEPKPATHDRSRKLFLLFAFILIIFLSLLKAFLCSYRNHVFAQLFHSFIILCVNKFLPLSFLNLNLSGLYLLLRVLPRVFTFSTLSKFHRLLPPLDYRT